MAGADRLAELTAGILERTTPHFDQTTSRVLVGLSGGADSAICAWTLSELGFEVHTLYVDHGWLASPQLGKAAALVAAEVGTQHRAVDVVVPDGPSPEAQARTVRYRALENEADRLGVAWIATGHTRDDQAETLVLNLMRGTGLDGMAGIWPKRGRLIRPLLEIDRSETRELAGLLELSFADDPTNLDLAIERNRVRALLNELGGVELTRRLAGSTQIVASDLELIGAVADGISLVEPMPGWVGLPAPALAAQPPAVRRRLIRRALRKIRGPYSGTSAEVERVLDCLSGEGGNQQLGEGVTVSRRGPWLWFQKGRMEVRSIIDTDVTISDERPLFYPTGQWQAVFDAQTLADAVVRPFRPDDVIEFDNGHKLVSDVLAEAGIEADRRVDWPVLALDDRVAWVVGCRTARWGWVGESTNSYLYAQARQTYRGEDAK